MALRLISREFTDANGRTGNYPKGVTNDIVSAKYTVEYQTTLKLSKVVQVIKNDKRFRLLSGDWESLISAFNGANIEFNVTSSGGGSTTTTTVDTVDGIDLYVVDGGGQPDDTYTEGYFTILEDPVSFEHYINLFQNSKKQGTKYSLIDGETQRFKVDLDNAISVSGTDDFVQYGKKSGGSIITSSITRIADVDGNKRYEIDSTFKYWLFLDDSIYSADDSIGFYTEIYAQTELGNTITNSSITDSILGDVGNTDESLNGGESPWSFTSIAWEDASANSMDAFDPTQASYFTIRIDGTTTGNEKFNFRFFRTPNDATEYNNKRLPIDNNVSLCTNGSLFTYATPTTKLSEANENGATFSMVNFEVTDNTSYITVTGYVQANTAMSNLLTGKPEDDRGYMFEVCIDDDSVSYQRATTVNVVCDEQDAAVNSIPLGTYTTDTFLVEDINGSDIGSSPTIPSEDYVRLSSTFALPKSTDENPWTSIALKVVAVKIDGSEFDLESFEYDMSVLPPNRDGILPVSYSVDRGYKLPSTSDKNEIFISRYPSLDDGSNFGVEVSYPFQIRYEDWLEQPNASDDFYGEKTKDWYTYSSDPEWSVEARIVLTRDTGVYTNSFDFSISKGASLTVFTFERLDGTPITKPLASEVTKVIATVTAPTDWTTDLWGVVGVRDTDSFPYWTLSTLEDPTDNNNPLSPLTDETRLKISNIAKELTFECLFDPSKISAKNVTFACRAHGNTL